MLSASKTIYYLEKSEGFADLISNGQCALMDPTVVIFKGIYLKQSEISDQGLGKQKLGLSQHPPQTLLRPIPSSDGPPFWSAIVYSHAGSTSISVREDYPVI